MAYRIQKSVNKDTVTFAVSGQLGIEGIAELKKLINECPESKSLVLDLKDIRSVDRSSILSLTGFKLAGVRLVNCPHYVRDWILRNIRSD